MRRFWLLLCGMLFVLASCTGTSDSNDGDDDNDDGGGTDTADGDGGTDSDPATESETTTTNAGCQLIDILFVIDDSPSMDCEQSQLTTAFPGFVDVLEAYNNANADTVQYRLGVTTTGRDVKGSYKIPGFPSLPFNEPGMNGEMVTPSGGTHPWVDGPGAGVSAAFSDIALVGAGGPSLEMPLESFRLALQKTQDGPNEGFLREDALFVAVIITDEDDCSTTFTGSLTDLPDDSCASHPQNVQDTVYHLEPLQNYRDYLDGLFGGPERYVLVGIAGANSCDSSAASCSDDDDAYAGAKEAKRLKKFFAENADPVNSVFADLCTVDLPDALQEVLDKMTVACDELVIE